MLVPFEEGLDYGFAAHVAALERACRAAAGDRADPALLREDGLRLLGHEMPRLASAALADPVDETGAAALALAHLEAGGIEEAEATVARARAAGLDGPVLASVDGRILLKQNRHDEALARLEPLAATPAAIDAAPAAAALLTGRDEPARLQSLLEALPPDPAVAHEVAVALLAAGAVDAAALLAGRLPPAAETVWLKAAVAMRAGREDEARQGAAAALQAHPMLVRGPARPRLRVGVLSTLTLRTLRQYHGLPGLYQGANCPRQLRSDTVGLVFLLANLPPRPEVAARIGRVDVIINNLANADLVTDAQFAGAVGAWSAALGAPVVNPAERIGATGRFDSAALLAREPDLAMPATIRLGRGYDLMKAAATVRARIAGPVIVRSPYDHRQKGLALAHDDVELLGALAPLAESGATVLAFHTIPPMAGAIPKFRAVRIGGKLRPLRADFGHEWSVGRTTGVPLMAHRADLQAIERRYLADPASIAGAAGWRALERGLGRFGLDYIGVDFAPGADGRPVVFEANAAMRILDWHWIDHFPYRLDDVPSMNRRFEAMLFDRAGVDWLPRGRR
jgi:hypothetical protein